MPETQGHVTWLKSYSLKKKQAGLESHLKGILKGKRLRLFETLLRGIDYPDKGLVQDMKRGFRLTGWLPDAQTRPSKVVPPSLHGDGLRTIRLSGASVALVAMMSWISSCGNRLELSVRQAGLSSS